MAAAGSISMFVSETFFYWVDSINARSKILQNNIGLREMYKEIVNKFGFKDLFKGYSASFYSSIMAGMIYFVIYKELKCYLKDYIPHN